MIPETFATRVTRLQEIPESLESPVPVLAGLLRWLLNLPGWLQIAGVVLLAVLLLAFLALIRDRAPRVRGWITGKSQPVEAGTAGARRGPMLRGLVVLVALAIPLAVFGVAAGRAWNYMQHDNDFCTGCHIMTPAFERFTESEHSELGCHDCHRQSLLANLRQLYAWVREKPEEIGEHSPVATEVCARCHIQEDPDATWQRIATTSGHRVHLESDHGDLVDVACVTCHGEVVHRFLPVDRTCGQAGCHDPTDSRLALGAMAGQTELHCVGCHDFTAEPSEAGPHTSTAGMLSPVHQQCLACHDMRVVWAAFDIEADPHEARCGACHNPHRQTTPIEAVRSCTNAGCHTGIDTLTPLHLGITQSVLEECTICHEAHSWRRDGTDCTGCHADVERAGIPAPADAFDHRLHAALPCTDCHSSSRRHTEVTIRSPGDCSACHHSARVAGRECAACHRPGSLGGGYRVMAAMQLTTWESSRSREMPFTHTTHEGFSCTSCHESGRPATSSVECGACHTEHHQPETECSACHTPPPNSAHTAAVHMEGCAGASCHGDTEYRAMRNTRSFCGSCHRDKQDHRPRSLCADCHMVPTTDGEAVTNE